jgi:hypothetical protein
MSLPSSGLKNKLSKNRCEAGSKQRHLFWSNPYSNPYVNAVSLLKTKATLPYLWHSTTHAGRKASSLWALSCVHIPASELPSLDIYFLLKFCPEQSILLDCVSVHCAGGCNAEVQGLERVPYVSCLTSTWCCAILALFILLIINDWAVHL